MKIKQTRFAPTAGGCAPGPLQERVIEHNAAFPLPMNSQEVPDGTPVSGWADVQREDIRPEYNTPEEPTS